MTLQFVGTTFPITSQWHKDEVELIKNISQQIEKHFESQSNLLINTTWFGPQFHNGQYDNFLSLTDKQKFQNLFLLSAVDPVHLSADQIYDLQKISGATNLYCCGHFDTEYQFNFLTQVIPKYFRRHSFDELKLVAVDWVYMNYNRKPRPHRIELVQKLVDTNLKQYGIVTLGTNNQTYSKQQNDLSFTLNETPDTAVGNWGMSMEFGIPHDIHSLGNMQLWQTHFLNVVGETEFLPWDNLLVSEKTWKPIIGLRPFVINGQTSMYAWLRKQGFRTFNHYWSHIEVENIIETKVTDSIVEVIEFLAKKSKTDLLDMWKHMLPDLLYNQQRFWEFSNEQKHRINHLFD